MRPGCFRLSYLDHHSAGFLALWIIPSHVVIAGSSRSIYIGRITLPSIDPGRSNTMRSLHASSPNRQRVVLSDNEQARFCS
ncbi:hypothetical protein C8R42DRAFT_205826 [Lentinula raphanica]|nr:hypothetical protein C8R42DRAFT_205826 [Lentinula raphanica]